MDEEKPARRKLKHENFNVGHLQKFTDEELKAFAESNAVSTDFTNDPVIEAALDPSGNLIYKCGVDSDVLLNVVLAQQIQDQSNILQYVVSAVNARYNQAYANSQVVKKELDLRQLRAEHEKIKNAKLDLQKKVEEIEKDKDSEIIYTRQIMRTLESENIFNYMRVFFMTLALSCFILDKPSIASFFVVCFLVVSTTGRARQLFGVVAIMMMSFGSLYLIAENKKITSI